MREPGRYEEKKAAVLHSNEMLVRDAAEKKQ